MRRIDNNHEFSYSLVNNYEGWLNSESDYNKYYGNSENPLPFEKFDESRRLNFYAQLFKLSVHPEYEQDDTYLVLGREFENRICNIPTTVQLTNKFSFVSNKGDTYKVILNSDVAQMIYNRAVRSVPKYQVEIKGILPNGLRFLGYADEVYENCIVDIKTTSNFNKANYDNSLQVALYLHFIDNYLVQRGFYQVTEFYKSKAAGINEFIMKDTFVVESERITDSQLQHFADLCKEILNNVSSFEKDLTNYKHYFKTF